MKIKGSQMMSGVGKGSVLYVCCTLCVYNTSFSGARVGPRSL